MKPMKFPAALFLLVLSSASSAFAEGTLSYTYLTPNYFSKLEVHEDNGTTEGMYHDGGVNRPVRASVQDSTLFLDVGNKTDALRFTVQGQTTRYFGLQWWGPNTFEIYSYDRGKGWYAISGHVADIQFQADLDANKKTLNYRWAGMLMQVAADPQKPGACKGTVYDEATMESLAKFICQSSGTLQDAFFHDPAALISWFVHLQMVPSTR